MQALKNLTIRAKLTAAFAVLLAFTIFLGLFSLNRLSGSNQASSILASHISGVQTVSDMTRLSQQLRALGVLALTDPDPARRDDYFKQIDAVHLDFSAAWSNYAPTIPDSGPETQLANTLRDAWQHFLAVEEEVTALSKAGERQLAETVLFGDMSEETKAFYKAALAVLNAKQQDAQHAQQQSASIGQSAELGVLIVLAIMTLATAGIGWQMIAVISKPITAMTRAMGTLAEGHLEVEIPARNRKDEIGAMASAVDVFKRNMIQTKALEEEKERDQAMKEQHQADLIAFIQSFEGTVLGVLDGLTHAEQMLRDTSTGVDRTATNVKDKAGSAGHSADGASENVQTVASTAEELTSSIQEISRQVADASTVANQAVHETDTAAGEIRALEQSVTKIGEIVDLINSIASQTNLLALNATIEAARAGEAGKGFAVVANEVKSLATQTARATDDIAAQIGQVQDATTKAVSAMGRIGQVIHNINQISTGIASAVEEQSAATAEIARSADMAAQSTQSVASLMGGLNEAAEQSGESAAEIAASSSELSKQSAVLKEEVRTFLNRVREGDENSDEAELVSWEDQFGFGVHSIDEDHRKLMDLTNALYREVKEGREGPILQDAFTKLRTYSTKHFAEEDEYMKRLGYPGADEHVRHHDAFVSRLDSLFEQYQQGDPGAGMDMTALLGSWWRNHIIGDDTALASYVRSRTGH